MVQAQTGKDVPACSFCGKRHDEVNKLIAGPGVNICDECVGLCGEVIQEYGARKSGKDSLTKEVASLVLEDIAAGYQRAQVLFTALRAEVFEHLRSPATAQEVAAKLGWDARGTRMLLDGLLAIGLLKKSTGFPVALNLVDKRRTELYYVNGTVAAECLVAGAPNDQRNILLHKGNAYMSWARLGEAVRTGGASQCERPQRSPEELRAFICGMADIGRGTTPELGVMLDLSGHRHLLDIGTGPGTYAIRMLRQHPQLRATLFDLPEVLPITQEMVEAAGVADRVELLAGDLCSITFPPGYDLVLLSNIIHSYGPEVNRDLIQRIYDGMAPGGQLIIKDFLVDAERSGPPFSLLFALNMLLHCQGGDTYPTQEVEAWTDAPGFSEGRFLELTAQTKLWVVRKPWGATPG